ncbi:FtsX-like permease family protein [candidate division KSB1 bacterium]|nr:FtsX-like permease family protein [candidate division KSB1 bacterium]
MLAINLALKNLWGQKGRTGLNVLILSFSFVAIIWTQGLYEGMQEQASQALKQVYYGEGQFWQPQYDPYDPLTLSDAHGQIPEPIAALIESRQAVPILKIQGSAYPHGRLQPVILNGIPAEQSLLQLPSSVLDSSQAELPAVIGARLAKSFGLNTGETLTVRWRSVDGMFDAREVEIAAIMNTTVQSVDQGQIWLALDDLQHLANARGEATLVVVADEHAAAGIQSDWPFKDLDFLLSDIMQVVKSKTTGSMFLYVLLLFLAMLAIFDTQILSIFKRRREIGTLVALGMTRPQVIRLFTLEGAMYGVLAALAAALYGLPLLIYYHTQGMAMPEATDNYGIALGTRLFPSYSLALIVFTILLVLITVTIVSYFPARRISKMKPTDAIRGKLS